MRAPKRHLIFFYLSFLCQAISNTLGISGFAPASPRITSPAREGGELWLQKNGVLSKKTTSFSQVSNRYLPLAAIKFNPYYSNSLIQCRISTFLNECNTHLTRFPACYISAPIGSVHAFGTMILEDFSSKRDKMWYFHVARGTMARYLSMKKRFNKPLRQI